MLWRQRQLKSCGFGRYDVLRELANIEFTDARYRATMPAICF